MNWIVAVGEHGSDAIVGPMVAAAAVFSADEMTPQYRYLVDGSPVLHTVIAFDEMPPVIQSHVMQDVQRRMRAKAFIRADGEPLRTEPLKVRRNTTGLAVARAMESFFEHMPDARDVDVTHFTVQLPDQTPIPSKFFPGVRQLGLSEGAFDWRCTAVQLIASYRRDSYLSHLDMVYPEYNLQENLGYRTKGHMRALHTYGSCSEHHFAGHPELAEEFDHGKH